MTSDFEQMTNAELRAYALEHRAEEDIEALRVLFRRRKLYQEDKTFYPPKNKHEKQKEFERFKRLIEEKQGKKKLKNEHSFQRIEIESLLEG